MREIIESSSPFSTWTLSSHEMRQLKRRVHHSHERTAHDVKYSPNADSPVLLITYDGEKRPVKRRFRRRGSENDVYDKTCKVKDKIVDTKEYYYLNENESFTPRLFNIGKCNGMCGHSCDNHRDRHRQCHCEATAEQPFDILHNKPKASELIHRRQYQVTDCGCKWAYWTEELIL